MNPIVVNGHSGRMSSLLCSRLPGVFADNFAGFIEARSPAEPSSIPVSLRDLSERNATIIDFTIRECTMKLLAEACGISCKLVIGTSGLTAADLAEVKVASNKIAIFRAANFSRGIHTALKALSLMRRSLDKSWRAQILELHFAGKLDTPSATAEEFARTVACAHDAAVNIASLRLGDAVSEHKVFIAGAGERIELAHKLLDRQAYLSTVCDAIVFLKDKQSGLYGMCDLYPE
jgi:4-hydroxy-tetrahydrodipicolinate reductase